jgi:hypothetical protein
MKVELNRQNLNSLAFIAFTVLACIILYIAISFTPHGSQKKIDTANNYAVAPVMQTIYEENTGESAQVAEVKKTQNSGTVLGVGSCPSSQNPLPAAEEPSNGLHPDCSKLNVPIPFDLKVDSNGVPIGGIGSVTVVYKSCVVAACVPENAMAGTGNCANSTCPMYCDSAGCYVKKISVADTFTEKTYALSAPTDEVTDELNQIVEQKDDATTTSAQVASGGAPVSANGIAKITYDPKIDTSFADWFAQFSTQDQTDKGDGLSTLPTNKLGAKLLDGRTAPGQYIDGRNYTQASACTQYDPKNNTIINLTNSSHACNWKFPEVPSCETKSITITAADIQKCIDDVWSGSGEATISCSFGVDLRLNMTGLLGNNFNVDGTTDTAGRAQMSIDAYRSGLTSPVDIDGKIDQTLDISSVTPHDNPLASTMFLTDALVAVNIVSIWGINNPFSSIPIPVFTTALWPDATFDYNFESQEALSIPGTTDILKKDEYIKVLQDFYSKRNIGTCTI